METQQGFLTSDLGVEENAHELADTRPKMYGADVLPNTYVLGCQQPAAVERSFQVGFGNKKTE